MQVFDKHRRSIADAVEHLRAKCEFLDAVAVTHGPAVKGVVRELAGIVPRQADLPLRR